MDPDNILPFDGWACYYPAFLDTLSDSDVWLPALKETLPWAPERVKMFGELRVLRREVVWYGLQPFRYRYSGLERVALPFTAELEAIRKRVSAQAGVEFNSVLGNRYFSGADAMGWHQDNEPGLVSGAPIASVSLGASRTFAFRHIASRETRKIQLDHGSLLVMGGLCQDRWQHALLKTARPSGERINLTFRVMQDRFALP